MEKETTQNDLYNRTIYLENNSFKNNSAMDFGGALFYKMSNTYISTVINNEISFNKAEIMGGGVYSANTNYQSFNIKNLSVYNNTINSFINNYSSKPSYLVLNNKLNSNTINIIPGESFSLNFTLYDAFNNPFIDFTKYYSSITLRVLLQDYYYNSDDNNLFSNVNLTGNFGSFRNGKKNVNNIIFILLIK